MAQYAPISPASLVPGLPGNDASWTTLMNNSSRLYGDGTDGGYRPVIAAGVAHGADDSILTTTGSTPVEVCRIMVPRNADNETVYVAVYGYAASGDTVTWALAHDSGAATRSSTATAAALVELTVTPTGSGHPRELILYHYGATASDTVYTLAYSFQVNADATASTGTNASGYVVPDTVFDASGEPFNTERSARLVNNSRAIAIDRPAGVYSLVEAVGWTGSRTASSVDSTQPTVVASAELMLVEGAPRTYRVSMYLAADAGVTPKCTVSIGAQSVTGTAAGWTHGTVTLGGASSAVMDAQISRTAGSGYAYLKTLQIMRET